MLLRVMLDLETIPGIWIWRATYRCNLDYLLAWFWDMRGNWRMQKSPMW